MVYFYVVKNMKLFGKTVSKKVKRELILRLILIIIAGTILLFFSMYSFGWFSSFQQSSVTSMQITISTGSYDVLVDRTTRYDAGYNYISGSEELKAKLAEEGFDLTRSSTQDAGKIGYEMVNEYVYEGKNYLMPGSFGTVTFYIRPKSNSDVIAHFDLAMGGYVVAYDQNEQAYMSKVTSQQVLNMLKGHVLFFTDRDSCSDMHSRYLTGYDQTGVNVRYDDCNPFGMIAGDFGDIAGLSKHTSETASSSIVTNINSLSSAFAAFMDNFTIPTDGTEYIPAIDGAALDDYTQFYNKAITLYDTNSQISFTKDLDNSISKSAVIGLNHPYAMAFGTNEDPDPTLIDFQAVVANLFGFSSKTDFMTYAQTLATTYASHRTALIGGDPTNEALDNGCFYTSNGSFVFPIVVNNELSATVLSFLIVDPDGFVSVWVNDVASALRATNFNATYYTGRTVNNELYCKNALFISGINYRYDGFIDGSFDYDTSAHVKCAETGKTDCYKIVLYWEWPLTYYDIAENISTTSPVETKKYPAEVGPYLSTHKEYFFATVPNSNKADVLSDAYNDGDQTIGDGANCLVLYIDAT